MQRNNSIILKGVGQMPLSILRRSILTRKSRRLSGSWRRLTVSAPQFVLIVRNSAAQTQSSDCLQKHDNSMNGMRYSRLTSNVVFHRSAQRLSQTLFVRVPRSQSFRKPMRSCAAAKSRWRNLAAVCSLVVQLPRPRPRRVNWSALRLRQTTLNIALSNSVAALSTLIHRLDAIHLCLTVGCRASVIRAFVLDQLLPASRG